MEYMSFNDIFKSDFIENVTSVSVLDILIALVLAFAIGLFIFLVHKKTYQGVMYSSSFGVALVALVPITTMVIMAVSSNIALSLGMVGALSIVRFRTAIKEPLDIAFLFWAIAVGIVLATGMIVLAVIGSVIIGVVMMVFVNRKSHFTPYILVLTCDGEESEKAACELVKSTCDKSVVKSKTVREGMVELNMELRLKNDETSFVNQLSSVSGVRDVAMVSYNGDYLG